MPVQLAGRYDAGPVRGLRTANVARAQSRTGQRAAGRFVAFEARGLSRAKSHIGEWYAPPVSKAFTKEDDGAGIALVDGPRKPSAPFRLTAEGARALARSEDPRVREALSYAEVVEPPRGAPERASIGVYVHVRDEDDRERVYHLVSAEEHALVGEGCSTHSPIGSALLGAVPGDIREVTTPRGTEELEVTELSYSR